MALRLNKKCIICGDEYRYCVNCRDNRPYEYWRNIYCSEGCKSIGELWYAYRGKEVSKRDAKVLMERHKDILDKVFALDTAVSKEIKDICDYKEQVIEEPAIDIVETPVTEQVDASVEKNIQNDNLEVNNAEKVSGTQNKA